MIPLRRPSRGPKRTPAAIGVLWSALALSLRTDDIARVCRAIGEGRTLCGPDRVTLPILPGGQLVVRGTLDGKPVRWLVDTGMGESIVSPELLGVANQSIQFVGELCVGHLCLLHGEVSAVRTPFSSPDAGKINGAFGMSSLRGFVVGLDGPSVTLAFHGVACSGKAHTMAILGLAEMPGAAVTIAGKSREFLPLDTGATNTILSQKTADELVQALVDRRRTSLCTVTGCRADGAWSAKLVTDYCVFGTCAHDVTVKYPIWDAIGFSTLTRFRVDIDFPSNKLVFCKR